MEQTAIKTTPAESIARRNAVEAAASGSSNRPFQRVASTPSQLWKQGTVTTERSPLLRRHSYKGETLTNEMNPTGAPAAGGTVLGIHNLAVVLPQFLVSGGELGYTLMTIIKSRTRPLFSCLFSFFIDRAYRQRHLQNSRRAHQGGSEWGRERLLR